MLTHAQLEFHNVAELFPGDTGPGLRMQRLPESLRPSLNFYARSIALSPTHAEIRYVSSSPEVQLTLHSEVHHEYLRVYQGDFFQQEICLEPGQTRTISLTRNPELIKFASVLRPNPARGFSPEVIRVRLSGTGRVRFVGVDTNGEPIRPPAPEEKPAHTLLAYGSSITQGFSAARQSVSYVAQATHLLGIDLINLGFGGSCFCEPAMADYLTTRTDWHVAWLELGINMLGSEPPFTDADFRERAANVIERLSRSPARLVFVATLPRARHDLPDAARPGEPWRQILRELTARLARPNVHLVEGPALIDWTGLTADLVHPADSGHAEMGSRVAACIAPHL